MKRALALFPLLLCMNAAHAMPHSIDAGVDREYAQGRAAARQDLKQGRLKFIKVGYLRSEWWHYKDIFHKKYNVTVQFGGCSPSTHGNGYNSIMRPAIEQKYGKDIWGKVEQRALRAEKKYGSVPHYVLKQALRNFTFGS